MPWRTALEWKAYAAILKKDKTLGAAVRKASKPKMLIFWGWSSKLASDGDEVIIGPQVVGQRHSHHPAELGETEMNMMRTACARG